MRFALSGSYGLRIQNRGSLLAYFDVVDTELGIVFRGGRLLNGKNGLFVMGPTRTYTTSEGEQKESFPQWGTAYDTEAKQWDPTGDAYFTQMANEVYELYLEAGGADTPPAAPKVSSSPARRPGRGPVVRPSARGDAPF